MSNRIPNPIASQTHQGNSLLSAKRNQINVLYQSKNFRTAWNKEIVTKELYLSILKALFRLTLIEI